MVEYGPVDELLVFWWSGFDNDPDELAILDHDLVERAQAWQETWIEHFARNAQPGTGPWKDARCWDSLDVAFTWAVEGVALYRELVRTLPDVHVRIDLWPLAEDDHDFYVRTGYWKYRAGAWTAAILEAQSELRSVSDYQRSLRRVLNDGL